MMWQVGLITSVIMLMLAGGPSDPLQVRHLMSVLCGFLMGAAAYEIIRGVITSTRHHTHT